MNKGNAKPPGLYANINATVTPKAYANMKAGFPKKKK
jgi:hypothetical protein